jgi:hypothetical protein
LVPFVCKLWLTLFYQIGSRQNSSDVSATASVLSAMVSDHFKKTDNGSSAGVDLTNLHLHM